MPDKNFSTDHLSEEARKVTQEKGTEAPFSGKYTMHDEEGTYQCVVCKSPLFPSNAKHDSTKGPAGLQGWPSFDTALPGAIEFREDTSDGMHRIEVVCATCGAHLGHIFDDPSIETTGKHLCINSCALDFEKGVE